MKRNVIRPYESFSPGQQRYSTAISLHCHTIHKRADRISAPELLERLAHGYLMQLELPALISITDRNSIEPVSAIRRIPRFSNHPISLEWIVPFGPSVLHLGIHNLAQ